MISAEISSTSAPETDFASWEAYELASQNIETERLETISIGSILIEDAIVDENHARDLGASMQKKRGQITPIAVRARIVDDQVVYDILDGFHRTTGKKLAGEEHINATVVYGCTDEEMYDLRILAASSVRSVQFPRIAQWITNSYATTPWAEKGIPVSTAFGMTVSDSRRSNFAEMDSEEIDELKDWVRAKCDRWGKTPTSTYQILRLVSNTDPNLITEVRASGGGGKDRVGRITPARLKSVVDAFPGENNFPAQNAILKIVVDRRMSAHETSVFVDKVSQLLKPGMSEDEIYQSAKDIKVEVLIAKTPNATIISDNGNGEVDWDSIEPDYDELDRIEKELIEDGEIDTKANGHKRKKRGKNQVKRPGGVDLHKAAYGRGDSDNIHSLRARIVDLENIIEKLNETQSQPELWWRSATYLTPLERTCMEAVMYRNYGLDAVANEANMTELQILSQIQSAFRKHRSVGPKPYKG